MASKKKPDPDLITRKQAQDFMDDLNFLVKKHGIMFEVDGIGDIKRFRKKPSDMDLFDAPFLSNDRYVLSDLDHWDVELDGPKPKASPTWGVLEWYEDYYEEDR